MALKKGPLNNAEKQYIRENCYAMSVIQIAENLNRAYNKIYDFIRLNVRPEVQKVVEGDVVFELKNSADWRRLSQELTSDELLVFEEQYGQMIKQFQEDILYTEKQQIFRAIRFDILMSRNMISRKLADEELKNVQAEYAIWIGQFHGDLTQMSPADRDFRNNILQQINSLKREIENKSSEYKILHQEYQDIMTSLKANRQQRIEKHQQTKGTFLELIEEIRDEEKNKKLGRDAELGRIALEKKLAELQQPHEFMDGQKDFILTTAKGVLNYIKDQNKEGKNAG